MFNWYDVCVFAFFFEIRHVYPLVHIPSCVQYYVQPHTYSNNICFNATPSNEALNSAPIRHICPSVIIIKRHRKYICIYPHICETDFEQLRWNTWLKRCLWAFYKTGVKGDASMRQWACLMSHLVQVMACRPLTAPKVVTKPKTTVFTTCIPKHGLNKIYITISTTTGTRSKLVYRKSYHNLLQCCIFIKPYFFLPSHDI